MFHTLSYRAGIDEDANVYIDDSFFDGQQGLDKLQVYLANKQVDLVVASRSAATLIIITAAKTYSA